MSVKLNLSLLLTHYTNNLKSVEVSGATVGECLENLINKFPDLHIIIDKWSGKLAGYISIFRDKEDTAIHDLNLPMKDGDELSIEYQPG